MSDTSPPCVQTSQKISDIGTTRETMNETDFRATDHFSASFKSLDIMRRNNLLCDIQFIIGDKKVFAHKNILASYSDYFQKMFYGNFSDSRILEINNVEITANSFELLIDFMYTSLLRINDSNVQELLRASSFLSLENVKEACQTFLKQTVRIENFIDITDMAVSYKLDNLYDSCLSYALQNYNDFVKSNVFLSLSYELLIKLIQSDDLCAVEEMVFESAMLWLKHDIVGRSKHSLDLLKAVRLCLMENEYLYNTVCQENLIKSNAQCLEYLLDIIKIEKGKDVHEMSSIFNVYHRKNTQIMDTNKILEDCTVINSSLNFTKSNKVIVQSAKKMVSSYKTMSVMRKDGILCDLRLKAGGKIIVVHKIILASNSEYFNKMFTGNINEPEKDEINIYDIKPDILELLIDYMYTSKLKITEINVLDILLTSDMLLFEDIHRRCIEFLKGNINVENCLKLKKFAYLKNINELFDSCTSFLYDNFTFIANSSDFLSLSVDEITELIQHDNLNAEEVKIFESVMCWIRHDIDNRTQYVLKLMESIRMSRIPFSYFNENIDNEEIIKNNCQALLYKTFKDYAKEFERNDKEIYPFYTSRRYYNNNSKLILYVSLVEDLKLELVWFTIGSEKYTRETLILNDPVTHSTRCFILGDGRIFCARCSKCEKRPSSMFDGITKKWHTTCNFRLCSNNCNSNLISMVELDGRIYVMTMNGDFNCFNIEQKYWITLKRLSLSEYNYNIIASDGVIYVVNKQYVYQYCKNTNEWRQISEKPDDRNYFASCCVNGFLYIIGGDDNYFATNSAMKFNISTKTWSNIADMHYARFLDYAGVTVVDGLIYVFWGDDIGSVDMYDPQLDKWTLSKIKLPKKKYILSNVIALNQAGNINADNISNYYSY